MTKTTLINNATVACKEKKTSHNSGLKSPTFFSKIENNPKLMKSHKRIHAFLFFPVPKKRGKSVVGVAAVPESRRMIFSPCMCVHVRCAVKKKALQPSFFPEKKGEKIFEKRIGSDDEIYQIGS